MPVSPFDLVIYALCIAVAIILVGAAVLLVIAVVFGFVDDRRDRAAAAEEQRAKVLAQYRANPAPIIDSEHPHLAAR